MKLKPKKNRQTPMLPCLEIQIQILQKIYVTQTRNSKVGERDRVAKRPQLKFDI